MDIIFDYQGESYVAQNIPPEHVAWVSGCELSVRKHDGREYAFGVPKSGSAEFVAQHCEGGKAHRKTPETLYAGKLRRATIEEFYAAEPGRIAVLEPASRPEPELVEARVPVVEPQPAPAAADTNPTTNAEPEAQRELRSESNRSGVVPAPDAPRQPLPEPAEPSKVDALLERTKAARVAMEAALAAAHADTATPEVLHVSEPGPLANEATAEPQTAPAPAPAPIPKATKPKAAPDPKKVKALNPCAVCQGELEPDHVDDGICASCLEEEPAAPVTEPVREEPVAKDRSATARRREAAKTPSRRSETARRREAAKTPEAKRSAARNAAAERKRNALIRQVADEIGVRVSAILESALLLGKKERV